MNRVEIRIPDRSIDFECVITIRVTDINYGNHLGNDSLVSMLHEARVQFLTHFGYSEFDIEGASLIQADLMVRFQKEAYLGENLIFSLYLENFKNHSFDVYYNIHTIRSSEVVQIAKAKVGLVFFDYKNSKITSVPELFSSKFDLKNE